MRSEIGRALGVLLVASREGAKPIGSGQLRAVEVVADLAALALDRDTLLEAEARRAREEARLTQAAEAVAGSLELDQVYERVVQHAAAVTGATRALLTRINSRTGELRTEAQVDFSEEPRQPAAVPGLEQLRPPGSNPRAGAARELRGGGDRIADARPDRAGPAPVRALSVVYEERGRFETEDLGRLVKLARSSAAAIANAIDYQRERRIARALTLGFVPESLPELQGYETGLLYAPAEHEPAGGDVYGAWPVGGGDEMALLVGDVAGKGVETAALSAMARFFIEARSWDTADPGRCWPRPTGCCSGVCRRTAS